MNNNGRELTTGVVWKKLLVFFLPIAAGTCIQQLYNAVDGLVVGKYVGTVALAAVGGSAAQIINLIIGFFVALTTGAAVVIAQIYGAGKEEDVQKASGNAIAVCSLTGVLLAAAGIIAAPEMLKLLKTPDDTVQASLTYLRIYFTGVPFILVLNMESNVLRSVGDSYSPFIFMLVGCVSNIIMDFAFVLWFGWGVAGAAFSTLLSRILAAIILFVFLRKPKQVIVMRDYRIRPDFDMIARILAIGIPSGIENSMFQFGKLAIQSSVSTLGTTAIAAQAMAIIFENINGIGGLAVGIGLMTMVGQTLGAGRKEEAKYYIVHLMDISNWIIILSCAITFVACKPVMWLAGMEPAAAKICYDMVIFITISKIFVWVPSFLPSYGLRAAGDVRFTMIVSSLSMWITRVAMVTYLIRVCGMGPIAVWIGMASDWCVRGVFFLYRFMSGKWLSHSVIEHPAEEHSPT